MLRSREVGTSVSADWQGGKESPKERGGARADPGPGTGGFPRTHSVHIRRADTPPAQLPFSRQLFLHGNFLWVRENTEEKHA